MSAEEVAEIRRRLTPDRLVTALSLRAGAQKQAGGWLVKCPSPSHRDSSPSCSVTLGDDGTTRVRCFGCDLAGDALVIVAAKFGLDGQRDFRMVLYEAGRACGVDVPYPSQGSAAPSTRYQAPPPRVPVSAQAPPARAIEPGNLGALAASLARRGLLEHAASDGWRDERGQLAIPWRDESGAEQTVQLRYCDESGDTSAAPASGPKYRFPAGGGARLPYGAHRAELRDAGAEVWIVEGAIDALAVRALARLVGAEGRVAPLGLPGVSSWPKMRDWVLARCRDRVVVIATDADEAGDRAATQIAEDVRAVARVVRRERCAGGPKDWAELLEFASRGGES